eukprot:scpid22957/ scgid4118/ 
MCAGEKRKEPSTYKAYRIPFMIQAQQEKSAAIYTAKKVGKERANGNGTAESTRQENRALFKNLAKCTHRWPFLLSLGSKQLYRIQNHSCNGTSNLQNKIKKTMYKQACNPPSASNQGLLCSCSGTLPGMHSNQGLLCSCSGTLPGMHVAHTRSTSNVL